MDLKDLYQDIIVDHNRSPRNFRRLADASHHAEGFNPLCGDKLNLYLDIDDSGRIRDIGFEGSGCAISIASASLMTDAIKGATEKEAHRFFEAMHDMLTGDAAADVEMLGKLAAVAGVRAFPSRVKCASLCWHTLNAALDETPAAVSTE